MNINPLTGIYSGASAQTQRTATNIHNTIAKLVSGKALSSSEDISGLAVAAQMQSRISVLRTAASNVSQGSSLLQVADDAIRGQIEQLDRMAELATQANNGLLDADSRKALNTEFQGRLEEFNRIAQRTSFNNQNLLDGSFSISIDQALGSEASSESAELTVPDLSADAVFGTPPDISTAQGAAVAQEAIRAARESLTSTRADIGSFAQSLDFAGASIESAMFNQEAARSSFADTDFADATSDLAVLNLQRNVQIALQAQTNKLPANVLDLLNTLI